MKTILRILSVVVVLGAMTLWVARGANRGWTKTQVEIKTLDEVTGNVGISYKDRFVPGLDFLGGALVGAGALFAVSLFLRNNKLKSQN